MNFLHEFIKDLLTNIYFVLPFTIGLYLLAQELYKRVRFPLFQPVLLTMFILIGLLYWQDIPYTSYKEGSYFLHYLLGPSVVALGFLLYQQSIHLKGRLVSILTSIFVGALVGILSVICLLYLFGVEAEITASITPKSVTSPIAMALSENSGGIPALTAVVVVIAGIFGGLVSPLVFRVLRIENKVAKGLALGASSHGMGTITAIQLGAVEGALGGLAIGIMGFFTAVLLPIVNSVIALF